ncbi:MAG: hypothetical protein BYD32DRAFT_421151 [Podila humilis]|nr:MAG: hypothetical protein BYD32DRAFT_421151 [Podila humilis]
MHQLSPHYLVQPPSSYSISHCIFRDCSNCPQSPRDAPLPSLPNHASSHLCMNPLIEPSTPHAQPHSLHPPHTIVASLPESPRSSLCTSASSGPWLRSRP